MDSSEEIRAIKARLDRIETWIRNVTKDSAETAGDPQVAAASDSADVYEMVSFDVKDVTTDARSPSYAYKLRVKNLTARGIVLYARVAFLDKEGFELAHWPINPLSIKPGQISATSGTAELLSREAADNVADIQAVVNHIL